MAFQLGDGVAQDWSAARKKYQEASMLGQPWCQPSFRLNVQAWRRGGQQPYHGSFMDGEKLQTKALPMP